MSSAELSIRAKFIEPKAAPISGNNPDVQSIDIYRILDADSTPDTTKVWADTLTLSGGALTVDLSSLTGMNGAALDLTGFYVHTCIIAIPTASAAMTFVAGATNGYGLFPATNATPVDDVHVMSRKAGFGTVGASAKTIDVTGTGTDSFYMLLACGTP